METIRIEIYGATCIKTVTDAHMSVLESVDGVSKVSCTTIIIIIIFNILF